MTTLARHTRSTKQRRLRRGFTLAEALIASVFLAIAVLGVSGTLSAASQEAQNLTNNANCQSLARELIEEISSKSYTAQPNPGYLAGGLNRASYDDIADYKSYTDSTTATGGMKTLEGTTIDFGDNTTYSRTVALEFRASPSGAAAASGDFAMVTVTVTAGSGVSVQLQRMLGNAQQVR
jgi:Tfp pilus assembly protein PilV